MTVYVDEAKHHLGRMIMCHMVADDVEELHEMADKIGLSRDWFQKDSSIPHYDVGKTRRLLAIKLGAVVTTSREIVKKFGGKRKGR